MTAGPAIVFDDVSKFYGETLGVNQVNLHLAPGITSLVGPNGAGKSTLMNLMTGLLQTTRGSIQVRGCKPSDSERAFRLMGYCTQVDAFPPGITGRRLLRSYLRLHGRGRAWVEAATDRALERVGLGPSADRRVAGYSKGMRQRIKLALAIAHDPEVLVLDEPLNGLDPLARSEILTLLRDFASQGRHVILSSHILHEVDRISDSVVLINEGYIVAEGGIHAVRGEMQKHPLQVSVRCSAPQELAAQAIAQDSVVEIRLHDDRHGLFVRTEDAGKFFLLLNDLVARSGVVIESVSPVDDDVQAVYQYLIEDGKGAS